MTPPERKPPGKIILRFPKSAFLSSAEAERERWRRAVAAHVDKITAEDIEAAATQGAHNG